MAAVSSSPYLFHTQRLFDDENVTGFVSNLKTFVFFSTNDSNNGTKEPPEEIYHSYQGAQLIFLVILFIVMVTGNAAVLAAVGVTRKRKKQTRMNFFILNLAIADLSMAFFSTLPDLIRVAAVQWYGGNFLCKLVKFAQSITTYASNYVLVSMSIDRLNAVARPMSFTGQERRGRILISLAWSLSVLFSVPLPVLFSEETLKDNTVQCYMDMVGMSPTYMQIYFTLVFVALFFLPALIITGCYAVIIHIVWKKSVQNKESGCTMILIPANTEQAPAASPKYGRDKPTNGHTGGGDKKKDLKSSTRQSSRGVLPQAKIKTIKMTLVIVLAFVFCWSPYMIFNLLQLYGVIQAPQSDSERALTTIIQNLAPINSAANPIIYGIFSTRICSSLGHIRICGWLQSLCPKSNPSQWSRASSMYSTTVVTNEVDSDRLTPKKGIRRVGFKSAPRSSSITNSTSGICSGALLQPPELSSAQTTTELQGDTKN